MSGIVPEWIPDPLRRREQRIAYPPGTARKTGLDSSFAVSVAWRPE
jgi:hypothetical protein